MSDLALIDEADHRAAIDTLWRREMASRAASGRRRELGMLALLAGTTRDALAADAYEAWQRRWKAPRLGHDRRLSHLIAAALRMAPELLLPIAADLDGRSGVAEAPEALNPLLADYGPAPMPLGACRAEASPRGRLWQKLDPQEREGQWLATLPVYCHAPGRCISYAAWLVRAWPRADDAQCAIWVGDMANLYLDDVEDCADAPDDIRIGAVNALVADWNEARIQVTDDHLAVLDIVAFDPRAPEKWWTRRGILDALGQEIAERQIEDGGSVRIYATPQRWNREGAAGAPGCCVLDWSSAFARRLLVEAKGLIGDDGAHAAELHKRAKRELPKIQFVTARAGR